MPLYSTLYAAIPDAPYHVISPHPTQSHASSSSTSFAQVNVYLPSSVSDGKPTTIIAHSICVRIACNSLSGNFTSYDRTDSTGCIPTVHKITFLLNLIKPNKNKQKLGDFVGNHIHPTKSLRTMCISTIDSCTNNISFTKIDQIPKRFPPPLRGEETFSLSLLYTLQVFFCPLSALPCK